MRSKWWVILAIACGTFMATLDASIVNIALTSMIDDLRSNLAAIKWVVAAYFLVITCLLLPTGRLSDQIGRKAVVQTGFITFVMASALCGISHTLSVLIAARVLQAMGAAMLMANGPAMVTSIIPPKKRGTALGVLSMAVSLGLIAGPALGGIIIETFGWRMIFFLNIPIGFLGAGLIYLFYDKPQKVRSHFSFNFFSALLQAVFLTGFVFLFEPLHILFPHVKDPTRLKMILAAVTALSFVLFFLSEKFSKTPLFEVSLFKSRNFFSANLAGFLFFVAYSVIGVLAPYFFEKGLMLPTETTSLLMTAIPVAMLIVSPISGRLSDRFGSKELCILGTSIHTLTLAVMAGLFGTGFHVLTNQSDIVWALTFIGVGLGLFQAPNNSQILSSVPVELLGSASAIMATLRNLGLFMGSGLGAATFAHIESRTHNIFYSTEFSFGFAAIISTAALIACFGKTRGAHWERNPKYGPTTK